MLEIVNMREPILTEKFGETTIVVRFDRPETKNPLSIETLESLALHFPPLDRRKQRELSEARRRLRVSASRRA